MPNTEHKGAGRAVLSDDRNVLDPDVIHRLERLGAAAGEDLMGQLAELFLADADRLFGDIREALAHADLDAVARLAHMLSGASANLGAVELARLCGALETAAAAGELAPSHRALELIAVEFEWVRLALCMEPRPS